MTSQNLEPTDGVGNERPTLIITIDPSLNNIEVAKLSRDKIAEAKRILDHLRFSDSFYLKVGIRYNSQALRYAVEENQPAQILNNIVRSLTGAYPNLDEALSDLA